MSRIISDKEDKVVAVAKAKGKLFELEAKCVSAQETGLVADAKVNDEWKLWHQRLGHVGVRRLKEMSDGRYGFKPAGPLQDIFCEACVLAKLKRKPHAKVASGRATEPLALVHADVTGPFRTPTPSGQEYFLTLTDDYSRYSWVMLLKHKSEVYEKFRDWLKNVTVQQGRPLKTLRSDSGGEFRNAKMEALAKASGFSHQFTPPYSPASNGVAERLNATLGEMARAMRVAAAMPQTYWGYAVMCAVYLKNRLVSKSTDGKTPFELWAGRKADLSHVRCFGAVAFAHVPLPSGKMADKAVRCRFVGYDPKSSGYLLIVDEREGKGKLLTSRSVVFNEAPTLSKLAGDACLQGAAIAAVEGADGDEDDTGTASAALPGPSVAPLQAAPMVAASNAVAIPAGVGPVVVPVAPLSIPMGHGPTHGASDEKQFELEDDDDKGDEPVGQPPVSAASGLRRSQRVPAPSQKRLAVLEQEFHFALLSVEEAHASPVWKEAMVQELKLHEQNGTWDVVPAADAGGERPIASRWVFKEKVRPDGTLDRRKARLVAKGCMQRYGKDFVESYSPVARLTTVRMLLALVVTLGLSLCTVDVTGAYLYGNLEESNLFMIVKICLCYVEKQCIILWKRSTEFFCLGPQAFLCAFVGTFQRTFR